MASPIKVCLFDAYGTLFDLHSAVSRYASEVGPQAAALSQLWRNKQIEYSWIRTGMASMPDGWRDFWDLTSEALTFSMASLNIENTSLHERLLSAYLTLDVFPEVPAALKRFQELGMQTAILTNGTHDMINAALAATGIKDLLKVVFSADDVKAFKPNAALYQQASAYFEVPAEQVVFHSSNFWDAAAASAFGFQVILINRTSQPAEYQFVKPLAVLPTLSTAPDLLRELALKQNTAAGAW